jgi:hypothetical protein
MTTTPSTADELAHWKRRALQAEAAVGIALWMRPLAPGGRTRIGDPETADQLATRLRQLIERNYPDLIVRDQHQKTEVFERAETCGCDENAEDYEAEHCESGEDVEYLCSKKRLGFICGSCEDEDGGGPAWKPYAVEWPCPPIAALDEPAAVSRPV